MEENCIFYHILLNKLMPTRSTYFARHYLRITSIQSDGIIKKNVFFMCYPGYKTKRFIQTKNTRVMQCIVALLFKKNVLWNIF